MHFIEINESEFYLLIINCNFKKKKLNYSTRTKLSDIKFKIYNIDDPNFKRVFLGKGFCIHLSSSPDFNHHIHITIGKFIKFLHFIKRNYKMCSYTVRFRTLYFSLVCSILKYGVIGWYTYFTEDTSRLKRI